MHALKTEVAELEKLLSRAARHDPFNSHEVVLDAGVIHRLVEDALTGHALHALVNSPELVDFPKGVQLEAAHQVIRWGEADRREKTAYEWHWLVAHLATRALEHCKEAERLQGLSLSPDVAALVLGHHREKAVHHCITTAAALCHWHNSIVGNLQPAPTSEVPA